MRFDDEEYIRMYVEKGQFPKIHDNIFMMDRFIDSGGKVLDIGCCTGLLSNRLACSHEEVIGIEPNKKSLDKAVRNKRVRYVNLAVSHENMREIRNVSIGAKAAYARRVLPEIWQQGGIELVRELAKTLSDAGVKSLVLEGRKKTSKAVNSLSSVQKEIEALEGIYEPCVVIGDCAYLEAVRK